MPRRGNQNSLCIDPVTSAAEEQHICRLGQGYVHDTHLGVNFPSAYHSCKSHMQLQAQDNCKQKEDPEDTNCRPHLQLKTEIKVCDLGVAMST